VAVVEGMTYMGGALLEKWSPGFEMKRKVEIYQEQRVKILAKFRTDTNDVFDQDLGWVYRSNYRGRLYSNNSVGLRGMREYERMPPADIIRISAFGDSFVYGNEVSDRETWTYQLEALLSNVEVLNFGVGGYGTDQAFLRYLKLGKLYAPHIVLIGFVPVQLPRNVSVYRRFISTSELANFKPRFDLSDNGEIVLVPTPVKSLEEHWQYYEHPELIRELGVLDYSYKPLVYQNPFYDYSATVRLLSQAFEVFIRRISNRKRLYNRKQFNPESDAFKITLKIFKQFSTVLKRDGATTIVLLFPSYEVIKEFTVKDYEPLIDAFRAEDIEFVDLANAFKGPVKNEKHYMPGGHFSPHSNRLIAQYLAAYLRERQLLP